MKTFHERVIDMRLVRETANGIFWISLCMLIGFLVLAFLDVDLWMGTPWVAFAMIAVSHQLARGAKRWLKYHNVPSEFAEPFNFDLDQETCEPKTVIKEMINPSGLPECEDSIRWLNGVGSKSSTEEMNYRAHA